MYSQKVQNLRVERHGREGEVAGVLCGYTLVAEGASRREKKLREAPSSWVFGTV